MIVGQIRVENIHEFNHCCTDIQFKNNAYQVIESVIFGTYIYASYKCCSKDELTYNALGLTTSGDELRYNVEGLPPQVMSYGTMFGAYHLR